MRNGRCESRAPLCSLPGDRVFRLIYNCNNCWAAGIVGSYILALLERECEPRRKRYTSSAAVPCAHMEQVVAWFSADCSILKSCTAGGRAWPRRRRLEWAREREGESEMERGREGARDRRDSGADAERRKRECRRRARTPRPREGATVCGCIHVNMRAFRPKYSRLYSSHRHVCSQVQTEYASKGFS